MKAQVRNNPQNPEQTLLHIIRVLPPERVAQLIDFARFLETQELVEAVEGTTDRSDLTEENEQWETLLATEDAQELLDQLADEALEEHRKGDTRPMRITDEGQITSE